MWNQKYKDICNSWLIEPTYWYNLARWICRTYEGDIKNIGQQRPQCNSCVQGRGDELDHNNSIQGFECASDKWHRIGIIRWSQQGYKIELMKTIWGYQWLYDLYMVICSSLLRSWIKLFAIRRYCKSISNIRSCEPLKNDTATFLHYYNAVCSNKWTGLRNVGLSTYRCN